MKLDECSTSALHRAPHRAPHRAAHHVRASCAIVLGSALVAMGCASLNSAPVEEARAAISAAAADPNVAPGSLDLEQAERHLALAEAALESGRYQSPVDHEADMASRYARVAEVHGEARLAQREASEYLETAIRDSEGTRQQVAVALQRARALDAEQTERGLVLTVGGVLFGFDSAELKPEAGVALARISGFLIAAEDREVLVEGFTDNVGTEKYNLQLSKQRAEAVTAALVGNRIEPSRIEAAGFGPAYPVASNEQDEGRALNRRVEIIILEPGLSTAQARRRGELPGVAAGPE
jgi:outer membrane protein OmpA-like peptidoglycan-associated protein